MRGLISGYPFLNLLVFKTDFFVSVGQGGEVWFFFLQQLFSYEYRTLKAEEVVSKDSGESIS